MEREDDVGDLNLGHRCPIALAVLFLGQRAISTLVQRRSLHLHRQHVLNVFDQVTFKTHGWADPVLKIAIGILVHVVVPVPVAITVNLQLDCVVTCCDRGNVPL